MGCAERATSKDVPGSARQHSGSWVATHSPEAAAKSPRRNTPLIGIRKVGPKPLSAGISPLQKAIRKYGPSTNCSVRLPVTC